MCTTSCYWCSFGNNYLWPDDIFEQLFIHTLVPSFTIIKRIDQGVNYILIVLIDQETVHTVSSHVLPTQMHLYHSWSDQLWSHVMLQDLRVFEGINNTMKEDGMYADIEIGRPLSCPQKESIAI